MTSAASAGKQNWIRISSIYITGLGHGCHKALEKPVFIKGFSFLIY